MRHTVVLPVLGDLRSQALVQEWLHAPGDEVMIDEPLVRVETDKASVEIPSPMAGILLEQLVAVDDEVPGGTPICLIEAP